MSQTSKIPRVIAHVKPLHRLGITGQNVTVAILDSGITLHPDLSKNKLLFFKDFVNGKEEPYDDYNHGIHVTGILASKRTGIAPGINIISLKVLDKYGKGSTDTFLEAISWILLHREHYNIRIVNISIGGSEGELQQDANRLNRSVAKLWNAGITVCCSAGNNGPAAGTITSPGSCTEVITVGSYDCPHFSSAGPLPSGIPKPELVAPGLHILSTTTDGKYHTKNGTSMSVPFISAYSALLLQLYPFLSNNQVKEQLILSAKPLSNLPFNMQGAGMVDLSTLFYSFFSHTSRKKREGSNVLL